MAGDSTLLASRANPPFAAGKGHAEQARTDVRALDGVDIGQTGIELCVVDVSVAFRRRPLGLPVVALLDVAIVPAFVGETGPDEPTGLRSITQVFGGGVARICLRGAAAATRCLQDHAC